MPRQQLSIGCTGSNATKGAGISWNLVNPPNADPGAGDTTDILVPLCYGRANTGTIRGDVAPATALLGSFHRS